MITDFSTYTNAGLRNITYNGLNSLTDLGILITNDTEVVELEVKSNSESLPHMQGNIDSSRADGTLYYEARPLIYEFKVFGESRANLKQKETAVLAWLNSQGSFTIQDSDYPNYEFRNCCLKAVKAKESEDGLDYMYIKVGFEADPIMHKIGTVNERIFKYAKTGGSTLTITNNASYSIDGGTAKSFSVQSPYTYRFVAYTENTPTVTLNGSALALDTPFIMPASATIAITHSGYGYYELWHDTREEVSP